MYKCKYKGFEYVVEYHSGWKNHILTAKINRTTREEDAIKIIRGRFGISEGGYRIIRREKKKSMDLIFLRI